MRASVTTVVKVDWITTIKVNPIGNERGYGVNNEMGSNITSQALDASEAPSKRWRSIALDPL